MTSIADALIHTCADADALARAAADWLLALALAKSGNFAVALSGGSTPRRLYETLSTPPYLERFPWARTHWFFGDERFVPPSDPQSNYRMVREAMLARAPVPAENVHAVATDGLTPEQSAAAYERDLKTYYAADQLVPARPLFDAVLLGLGTDGHTASLFPGSSLLDERIALVAADTRSKTGARITLTYPALASTHAAAFLVAGAEKRRIFAELRQGNQKLPAGRLQVAGELRIFADEAALGIA